MQMVAFGGLQMQGVGKGVEYLRRGVSITSLLEAGVVGRADAGECRELFATQSPALGAQKGSRRPRQLDGRYQIGGQLAFDVTVFELFGRSEKA